jgi:hypothetical protein
VHEICPDMSPYTVRTYMAIREHWYYKGSGPSQFELQLACRCSSTTVRHAFVDLRRRGLLLAPKFGVRTAKPTDMSRTISNAPLDPWAELADDGPVYWPEAVSE